MRNINLTWEISQKLEEPRVKDLLKNFECKEERITSGYQKWLYRGIGVTIICFESKLVVQGQINEHSLYLIKELHKINGLTLDKHNSEKFTKLSKFPHNAIFCTECGTSSMLIEGKLEDLDIIFEKECKHKNDLVPPLLMFTNRILPDVNILIAGNLSKCIGLGYFEGFEIVIPDFIMKILNTLGGKKKSGALEEIDKLRHLASEDKIAIFYCNDGFSIPPTEKEFQQEEDNIILEIANLTNSILFTGDNNLKTMALLNKRPTIYINPQLCEKIKTISGLRRAS